MMILFALAPSPLLACAFVPTPLAYVEMLIHGGKK